MAGRLTLNGAARALTVAAPDRSRSRMDLRVGSARAANTVRLSGWPAWRRASGPRVFQGGRSPSAWSTPVAGLRYRGGRPAQCTRRLVSGEDDGCVMWCGNRRPTANGVVMK